MSPTLPTEVQKSFCVYFFIYVERVKKNFPVYDKPITNNKIQYLKPKNTINSQAWCGQHHAVVSLTLKYQNRWTLFECFNFPSDHQLLIKTIFLTPQKYVHQ